MRQIAKKLFLLLPITSALSLHAVTPYFSIRSQGVNAARDIAGLTNVINLDEECVYGTVYGLFEYTRSFRPRAITNCLFGSDIVNGLCNCDPSIVISGSQTVDRAPTDWLADYFGLPTDFKSYVSFKPVVENFIIDLGFYLGLDEWVKGLYFRASAPITHTKWFLDMRETVTANGINSYPSGYFSQISESNLLSNFTEFANGMTPTFTTDSFDNLANAKMSSSPLVQTGVAEVRFALGWNYACDDYHIGVNARFAAPAGTRPHGEFLFEPIVGNGHHWEFGGGITAGFDFWHSDDEECHAGVYIDANITHLFTARQRRTFDLKGKPNSRYMLAEKLGTPPLTITTATGAGPILTDPPFPNLSFQDEFSSVANLTTMDVDVDIAAQGDLVVMLNYTHRYLSWDLGYNFWGITCEKIKKNGCPSPLDDGMTWALKGDASVVGFEDDSLVNPPGTFPAVFLAATESMATIHGGTNFPATGTNNPTTITADFANPSIDNATLAISTDPTFSPPPLNVVESPAAQSATNPQTRSSVPPIFLTLNDVDFAGTRGISHKIFTHLNYTWLDCERWTPYLGIGAEVEFGSSSSRCSTQNSCSASNAITNPAIAALLACPSSSSCPTTNMCPSSSSSTCHPCSSCSISQWGVWIKGGVAFN